MAARESNRQLDLHDLEAVSGALYFVMGRGTESGASSYHLSVAGVTVSMREPLWGSVAAVAQDSGYSLGTVQLDLGQRGEWPLGAVSERALRAGERTYVDAIIIQAAGHAHSKGLPFAADHVTLRRDLLSHGDGRAGRSALRYIDTESRDAINAWAASAQGRQWIHRHIDYPQIRSVAHTAMTMMDRHGAQIPEALRFPAISLIAKTANQLPGQLHRLERVLAAGEGYSALRREADSIRARHRYYEGTRAADIALGYQDAYRGAPDRFERAHAQIGRADFDPVAEAGNPDLQLALHSVVVAAGERNSPLMRAEPARGRHASRLQHNLVVLGYLAATAALPATDRSSADTLVQAIRRFQRTHAIMPMDGAAGPRTLAMVDREARLLQAFLHAAGTMDDSGRALHVDGFLGNRSRQALASYQRSHGFDATGRVDAQTRAWLVEQGGVFADVTPSINRPAAGSSLPSSPHGDIASRCDDADDPLCRRISQALADSRGARAWPSQVGSGKALETLLMAARGAGFTADDELSACVQRASATTQLGSNIAPPGEYLLLQRVGGNASSDPVANRVRIPVADLLDVAIPACAKQADHADVHNQEPEHTSLQTDGGQHPAPPTQTQQQQCPRTRRC